MTAARASLFSSRKDTQRDSTVLSSVDPQLPLLDRAPVSQDISLGFILARPNLSSVIRFAQEAAGFKDKQMCDALGVDKATWSRILSGDANVPMHKWEELNKLLRDLPLYWLANRRGFDLRPQQSDLERRVAELEAELHREREKRDTIVRFVQETRR